MARRRWRQYPGTHETLPRCRIDVGPPSLQYRSHSGQMKSKDKKAYTGSQCIQKKTLHCNMAGGYFGERCSLGGSPANTRQSPDAVSMSGQRRRRWTNIETASGDRLVFAGSPPGQLQPGPPDLCISGGPVSTETCVLKYTV